MSALIRILFDDTPSVMCGLMCTLCEIEFFFFSPSWVRLELKHKETTALDSAKMKTYVLFLFSASLKHSCLIVATLTFSVKLKNPFYGPSEHYKSNGDMGSICLHFVVCLLNVYLRFFKKFCDCCSLMQK